MHIKSFLLDGYNIKQNQRVQVYYKGKLHDKVRWSIDGTLFQSEDVKNDKLFKKN